MNQPTPFDRSKKLELMRKLMWDYDIPPGHCLEVLEGKRKQAGHYTETTLFRKLLESYRWHTILRLMPVERIQELLDEPMIQSLRFTSLKDKYAFVKERLQEIVPTSG